MSPLNHGQVDLLDFILRFARLLFFWTLCWDAFHHFTRIIGVQLPFTNKLFLSVLTCCFSGLPLCRIVCSHESWPVIWSWFYRCYHLTIERSYGTSPISIGIVDSYVKLWEGTIHIDRLGVLCLTWPYSSESRRRQLSDRYGSSQILLHKQWATPTSNFQHPSHPRSSYGDGSTPFSSPCWRITIHYPPVN